MASILFVAAQARPADAALLPHAAAATSLHRCFRAGMTYEGILEARRGIRLHHTREHTDHSVAPLQAGGCERSLQGHEVRARQFRHPIHEGIRRRRFGSWSDGTVRIEPGGGGEVPLIKATVISHPRMRALPDAGWRTFAARGSLVVRMGLCFCSVAAGCSPASAYHDIHGNGAPFALCAVTTCGSLFGPNGVSVDASHEILETAGDEGANQFANDNHGLLHVVETCDAVEVQTYGKTCKDGTVVLVSIRNAVIKKPNSRLSLTPMSVGRVGSEIVNRTRLVSEVRNPAGKTARYGLSPSFVTFQSAVFRVPTETAISCVLLGWRVKLCPQTVSVTGPLG